MRFERLSGVPNDTPRPRPLCLALEAVVVAVVVSTPTVQLRTCSRRQSRSADLIFSAVLASMVPGGVGVAVAMCTIGCGDSRDAAGIQTATSVASEVVVWFCTIAAAMPE